MVRQLGFLVSQKAGSSLTSSDCGLIKMSVVNVLTWTLQTPLNTLTTELGLEIDSIAESRYDDTSLALLYSQLKPMSLQTMKGASEIPGQTEFNFVKQIARVFCRMGEPYFNNPVYTV